MSQFSVVTWYNESPYAWGLTGIEVPFPSQDNINYSVGDGNKRGKKGKHTVLFHI